MKHLILIATALAAAFTPLCPSIAQTARPAAPRKHEGRPIVIGHAFELRSKVLGDTRTINVQLPEHYGEPGRHFPVLVVLDGGVKEDFVHIAALAQITAAYDQGQELIVIGIAGVDRRHDLTSPSTVASDLKAAPTSGAAGTYRRFLVDELKPWIDKRYPQHGRFGIIGESLAGLFILDTLLEEPTAFDDYIAVSPSLWWAGGRLAKTAAGQLRRVAPAGRRLWIGFDEPAPPADLAAKDRALQDALAGALRDAAPAGLKWSTQRLDEGHASIYHPAALRAFRALYPFVARPKG